MKINQVIRNCKTIISPEATNSESSLAKISYSGSPTDSEYNVLCHSASSGPGYKTLTNSYFNENQFTFRAFLSIINMRLSSLFQYASSLIFIALLSNTVSTTAAPISEKLSTFHCTVLPCPLIAHTDSTEMANQLDWL